MLLNRTGNESESVESLKIIEFSASDRKLLNEVTALRAAVWNKQLQMNVFPTGNWSDSHDLDAYHWAILNRTGQVVAAARLCVQSDYSELPDYEDLGMLLSLLPTKPERVGMFSRLVVHPAYQRKGLAKKLDQISLNKAKQINCKLLMLEVPSYRRKAVTALGFDYVGEVVDQSPLQKSKIEFYLYATNLTCKS